MTGKRQPSRRKSGKRAGDGILYYTILKDTPIGALLVAGDQDALQQIRFLGDRDGRTEIQADWIEGSRPLREVVRQLTAYFRGRLTEFELPMRAEGTAFQQRVWQALRQIPFGRTASYGDIARQIGQPSASRAVGAANGKNPIPIVVPCHRIIGSGGALVGFGGGLPIKRKLLQLEGIPVRPVRKT